MKITALLIYYVTVYYYENYNNYALFSILLASMTPFMPLMVIEKLFPVNQIENRNL